MACHAGRLASDSQTPPPISANPESRAKSLARAGAMNQARPRPAATDGGIVRRLNEAINEGLRTPELKAALARVGNVPIGGSPEDLGKILQAEHARWAPIVKALNLTAN